MRGAPTWWPGTANRSGPALFLRLFRSLDAIVAGDEPSARGWLQAENTALGGVPGELIQTLPVS